MKKVNYLWICVLSILLALLNSDLKSQTTYDPLFGHHCVEDLSQYLISSKMNSNTFGGKYKPERTNIYTGTSNSSVFRVLIVYVQFPNDTIDVNNLNWDTAGPPSYMNSLLAQDRVNSADWWNAYSETSQRLSDYWMEVSRGNMHMVGNSYYVKLSHPWWWYGSNGSLAQVNSEIYDTLNVKVGDSWSDYDNWTLEDNTIKYEKDGLIDMMYVVHRTWKPIGVTPGSIAQLYNSTQVDSHFVSSGDIIVAGFGADGSGCTFTPGAACGGPCGPFGSDAILGLICHELGHYHFGGGHGNYGVMMGDGAIYGMDCRHSPWETIKLSYIKPIEIDFSEPRNGLKDFSSRTSSDSGEILKVPINGSNEFFLIASRNKVSSYDRIMLGDTAHDNPYRVINAEYGKGVYIYHVQNGYYYSPTLDQECADGLFYWSQNGTFYPDWVDPYSANPQTLPYYIKDSVSYNNDITNGGLSNCDEKSIVNWNWGGEGKANTSPGYDGTDRIYVTDEVAWTSRSWKGDRWDAWRTGYNEVFSPYSSPSTKDWYNNASDIFIYLNYRSSSIDSIMIYKVGENNMTEEDILQLTPPSRPMGLTVSISECDNDKIYPVLTWNHNMEPDMIQGEKLEDKRYKVFRAYNQYGTVPDDYEEVADLLINKDEQPSYMDLNAWNSCLEGNNFMNSIRYKIIAIDSTNWASVYSDFVSFSSEDLERGDNMGNFANNNTVKKYELSQNYPNPFNPVTKINYALPKQGFVSLKIYDITGREIQTLVNEVKQEGYYTVDFNGSHLSSGVYFYRIQSGNFVNVKRMVLIK